MDLFAAAIHDLSAPETEFARSLAQTEAKLRIVVDTLGFLGDSAESGRFDVGIEALLEAIVERITPVIGAATLDVFRLDPERGDLVASRRSEGQEHALDIRLPLEGGGIGEALATGHPVRLGSDLANDPRARAIRALDATTGSLSTTALLVPLIASTRSPLGLVVATNRRSRSSTEGEAADRDVFGDEDEAALMELVPILTTLLECSDAVRSAAQRQRAVAALMHATKSIGSSLDLDATLARVMDEAKELMNADRSTLWLVDHASKQLWTQLPSADGVQEIRIPLNAGFAGVVATTGRPVNIPFDLYAHPNAYTAKQVDQKTGYRTCSLLCLPVHNSEGELIGVTQLVNKKRPGGGPDYDPSTWPEAPEVWRASFTHADQEYMAAFNQQAGVALQNAQLFATVRQQEQMQRDILRNLSNGVVAVDGAGRVTAANDSARQILGLAVDEEIVGRLVTELVHVDEGSFDSWLQAALSPPDEKSRRQYHPELALTNVPDEQRSVNLSIGSMSDAADPELVSGALVVLDDISQEKRLKTTMYRYMTRELAEQLLGRADGFRLGGDRKYVSVLFSDIRSYTTLTERMDPEDVVQFLNAYFEVMVEAIFDHKGTLDKYIGDAIMAVFGSPLVIDDHAWCAVQSAVKMRQQLEIFNASRVALGDPEIAIGIGINSDEVISGNIGSSKRMEFTAIGDGINLGSRLEGISKIYGVDIVISEETFRLCSGRAVCRELDTIRVKGKTDPVAIFELVELSEGPLARPLSAEKVEQMAAYATGRTFYLKREYAKASTEFERALRATPRDKASLVQLERCKQFIEDAPPEEWSGIWQFKEK